MFWWPWSNFQGHNIEITEKLWCGTFLSAQYLKFTRVRVCVCVGGGGGGGGEGAGAGAGEGACVHVFSLKTLSIVVDRKRKYSRPRWLSWMRRPTGDQEVAGSTPAEVGNILSWWLIMKYFLRSFSTFNWFKKGSCQFLAKEMCTILVNRLED